MQCAGKNYDCEEYGNYDGWNEPSGHGGYSCEVLGSSHSGDAPLGMHAGQQQHRNNNCCRREDKKVCDTFISRQRRWRIETAYEGAHAAMVVKVCVQYPMASV